MGVERHGKMSSFMPGNGGGFIMTNKVLHFSKKKVLRIGESIMFWFFFDHARQYI